MGPRGIIINVTLTSFIADGNSQLAAVTQHACSCGIWAHKLISAKENHKEKYDKVSMLHIVQEQSRVKIGECSQR
ncbi:hypothetical protein EVAR_5185_1 [Eumeta japonica]|uniref:Uncharacterized protein n=1 Tax=Eumeta variegata TaxID=151549 RepID=A0A4C1V4L7_EUMVA|nr:hypothetical protein EVAR_5185_1 [Eumeta japonica]